MWLDVCTIRGMRVYEFSVAEDYLLIRKQLEIVCYIIDDYFNLETNCSIYFQ